MVDKIAAGFVLLMAVIAIYRRVSGLGESIKDSFRNGKEQVDEDAADAD
jgi:hypothetical protein